MCVCVRGRMFFFPPSFLMPRASFSHSYIPSCYSVGASPEHRPSDSNQGAASWSTPLSRQEALLHLSHLPLPLYAASVTSISQSCRALPRTKISEEVRVFSVPSAAFWTLCGNCSIRFRYINIVSFQLTILRICSVWFLWKKNIFFLLFFPLSAFELTRNFSFLQCPSFVVGCAVLNCHIMRNLLSFQNKQDFNLIWIWISLAPVPFL